MTQMLATIFGVYMLCAGLGCVINKGWAGRILDGMEESDAHIYLTGAIVLIAGTALILNHNIWVDWKSVMVSLIGWGAAIEGAMMLIYPKFLFKISRGLLFNDKVVPMFGVATMMLGAALIWL